MLAFITVIGNGEHDQDGDSLIKVYILTTGTYPAARYKVTNGEDFDVMDEPDVGEVPWIPIDPVLPNLERWPKYGNSKPVHCTVHAGDVLYLPSLWFHHVRQEHATIAGILHKGWSSQRV